MSPAFASRVVERTGVELADILSADASELAGAHILCHDRSTNTYVVFVGYPDRTDDDGMDYWPPSALRRIVVPTCLVGGV